MTQNFALGHVDLRGAFNEFTARLHMPKEGSWQEVLKHKHKRNQEEGHPNLSVLSSVLTKVDNDTKAREL